LRGGQVDCVETAKAFDREQSRSVEQRVVDAHKIESLDDLAGPADRRRAVVPHCSNYIDPGKRA
jgi:hypothetical protein